MPTETSKAYLHIYKRNCCFLLCLTTNMHFGSTACFAYLLNGSFIQSLLCHHVMSIKMCWTFSVSLMWHKGHLTTK